MYCLDELVNLSYNQRVEDLQNLVEQFKEIANLGDKNHTVTVYDYSTNKLYLNGHISKISFNSYNNHLSGSDNYVCVNFYELNKVLYIKLFDLEINTMTKKISLDETRKDKVKIFFPCIKILKIKTLKELFDEFCSE